MNGIGKNGVSYTVDGTDASGNPEGRYSSNYLQPNLIDIMSIEAIQEVHTIKGVPPAEYGNMVAGQVNLLSRSGTNQWHGSLFENFRAEELDARNQRLPNKPGLTFNQFGGSVGGRSSATGSSSSAFTKATGSGRSPWFRKPSWTARLRNEALAVTPFLQAVSGLSSRCPISRWALTTTPDSTSTHHFQARRRSRRYQRRHPHRQHQQSVAHLQPRPAEPTACPAITSTAQTIAFSAFGTSAERPVTSISGAKWTSESRFGYHLTDIQREDAFFFQQLDPNNKTELLPFGRRVPRLSYLGTANPDQELYGIEGRTYNFDQKYARHAGKQSWKFGFTLRRDCCRRNNPEAPNVAYSSRADFINNIPNSVGPTYGNGDLHRENVPDRRLRSDRLASPQRSYAEPGDSLRFLLPSGTRGEQQGAVDRHLQSGRLAGRRISTSALFAPATTRTSPTNGSTSARASGSLTTSRGKSKTVVRGGFGVLFSGQVAGAMWAHVQPDALRALPL